MVDIDDSKVLQTSLSDFYGYLKVAFYLTLLRLY